ncbi:transketolase [Candidatus Nomurabacteria bacterium]|nr:transketolase [Candidatus Nomurabacteria bacterium]
MEKLTNEKIKELGVKANNIRKSIVEMLYHAGSGHTAGSLGMADIFTYLYFVALKHKPENPTWSERDHLVLSNGHICPVLYATMAHSGYFKVEELNTLRKFGSRLQGHPHREFLPILESSSGPLGEGLSQAVGMAVASKMDNGIDKRIYCLLGDGELNEGQNWEAIMLGAKEKLNNLIVIVDRNNIQIDGSTEIVMPLNDLAAKWKSFNWEVYEINGHNFKEIHQAIYFAKNEKNKPSVIIAKTIPSKGVSEWEGNYRWHGKSPNKEEYEMAMKELDSNK